MADVCAGCGKKIRFWHSYARVRIAPKQRVKVHPQCWDKVKNAT